MEFINNRRVLSGKGAHKQIPDILLRNQRKKAFLAVYDRNADFVQSICQSFRDAGLPYLLYDQIRTEPNLALVDEATSMCLEHGCDCVVAVGGGSVIDTSKLIAMLAANGGCCEDYQLNLRKVAVPALQYIAVPTTAGTGAEATKVAVVFNENKGWKKAVYDYSMIAETVILDPAATELLPKHIRVFTGMDAISHALESLASKNADSISRVYSVGSLQLLVDNIIRVCDNPQDEQARVNMQIGSYLAGCALTAGSGLAHIVGQPLGALYHVPHGASCSIFLLPTLQMNKDYAREAYTMAAHALGIYDEDYDVCFRKLVEKLRGIMEHIDAPRHLYDYYPVDMDVESALDNIQGCMSHIQCNPRPSTREVWRELIDMAV